jgi:hypothetical protein
MYFPDDNIREYAIEIKKSEPIMDNNYMENMKYMDLTAEELPLYSGEGIWDTLGSIGSTLLKYGAPVINKAFDYKSASNIEKAKQAEKERERKEREDKAEREKITREETKVDRAKLLELLEKTIDPKERLELIKALK